MLAHLVRLYFWLLFTLKESKLSIKRLKALIFGQPTKTTKTAKAKPSHPSATSQDADDDTSDSAQPLDAEGAVAPNECASDQADQSIDPDTPSADHQTPGESRRGHGRLSADAYTGAERVACRHQELAPGDRCPVCGIGWLYLLPPGSEMRINGHALLSAIRYEVEKLRCSACGERFSAPLPQEAGREKYQPSARSAMALSRYFLGVPFYRSEAHQAMVGVPVPDATQWDQVERVADSAYHSMLKFFVIDVLLVGGVAVSSGPALDSAFAPSFLGRPFGQLP